MSNKNFFPKPFPFLFLIIFYTLPILANYNGQKHVLQVTDFDSKEERNNIDGGYFGVWQKDPDDDTQGCRMRFFEPGRGGFGYCLELEYDVDSPNPAYNGFWLLFDDLNLSSYKKVSFWVKGDKKAGYTQQFKIELKSEEEVGSVIVSDVSDKWRRIEIPLDEFSAMKDLSRITEFVIVFEDRITTKKEGAIYIDNLAFEK